MTKANDLLIEAAKILAVEPHTAGNAAALNNIRLAIAEGGKDTASAAEQPLPAKAKLAGAKERKKPGRKAGWKKTVPAAVAAPAAA